LAVACSASTQSRGIAHLDRRINDLRDSINNRFDDLRDLLKSEIKRVEERIERLEHPIAPRS
jgi:hypothetical protein